MTNQTVYQNSIRSRSKVRFIFGLFPRLISYLKNYYITNLAKRRGAIIGKNVTMPYKLAKIANSNLCIGDSTSIQTSLIDLRSHVNIGSNVIIGAGVEILTCSHNINSPGFEFKSYGIDIEDFCWIATRAFILPSCRKIARGAVCGAGCVVMNDVETMSVVSGNPAKHLKFRNNIHSNLIVESLTGNDLLQYIKVYIKNF